jgi:site-specific recombinase XerD
MTDKYREYEKACERIRRDNKHLLSDFGAWLMKSGLSEKTMRQHVQNIDIYVNDYLLCEDPTEAKEGVHNVGMFLGYWFIKKVSWSSESAIRSNVASLKKFYSFMQERGLISEEALSDMREKIKEDLPEWLATMRHYDDPSITDPTEIWGL